MDAAGLLCEFDLLAISGLNKFYIIFYGIYLIQLLAGVFAGVIFCLSLIWVGSMSASKLMLKGADIAIRASVEQYDVKRFKAYTDLAQRAMNVIPQHQMLPYQADESEWLPDIDVYEPSVGEVVKVESD